MSNDQSPKPRINWYPKTNYQLSPQLKSQTQFALSKLLAKTTKPSIIDISFISKEGISKLNQKYRHISQPTDVLSFPLHKNLSTTIQSPGPIHLGEIVICPAYLEKPSDKEIINLVIHGAKHLIGRHHI